MDEFAPRAADALRHLDGDPRLEGVTLTLEQHVTGEDGVTTWHVRIADGTVIVADGIADDPDVTLRQDRETALALRSGELHAQQAFLTGRLQIEGDIDALLRHGDLLADLIKPQATDA